MSIIFAAPIPGQSLTTEPKNMPFERPPEIVDPIEALDMHIENITNQDAMEDALYFLEKGLTLTALVEGVLRSAVKEGMHSIDVSLIIAPVLHEYIKGLALESGVEFDEGFENPEAKKFKGIVFNCKCVQCSFRYGKYNIVDIFFNTLHTEKNNFIVWS